MTLSEAGPHVEVYATKEPVGIWSGEHRAWWKPNRCGYTTEVEGAGRYSLAEALRATHHVGPEKQIVIDDLPHIPEWTEGVCGDAAIILRDGQPVPISELLDILNGRRAPK